MQTIIKIVQWFLNLSKSSRGWIFAFIYFAGVLIYKFCLKADWLQSFYHSAALFTLNINVDFENAVVGWEWWIYPIGLLAALYTVISLISLLAKKFIDTETVKLKSNAPYILVCGLGEKASAYIDSEIKDNVYNIIAIENNPQNPNIEKYRAKGIAVKVADAGDSKLLKALNVSKAKHIVSLAGKDTSNLEIALAVRDALKDDDKVEAKKLYMHIDDRALDKFYKDGGLLDDSSNLHIKMFSMSRNSAKALFLEHDIDGESRMYIDSDKPFGIVVAGSSKLAVEVIGQACEVAHLPNENEMTIYCLDKECAAFKKTVELRYQNIDKIPNIKLVFKELDHHSSDFYRDKVWKENITNIMLCHEDEQVNLDIAAELADTTYLYAISNKSLKSKIHIAIYDNKMIAKHIHTNQEHFKYFDVFAQTSQMASKQKIIDEQFEMIARCIHSGYEESYNTVAMYGDTKAIEKKWNEKARLTDRDSNRAQAYHIPVKLKALGLRISFNTSVGKDDHAKRLLSNRKFLTQGHFADELKNLGLDDATLQQTTRGYEDWDTFENEYRYFPEKFELLMEKLIRSEHNRWNAHHYLKGWKYNEDETIKPLKEHRCIIPLPQMDSKDRYTILYDIYSVLYMPNLLAKVGLDIEERK